MNCPKCDWATHRAAVTTQALSDQIVRKRKCCACHHTWFTVEVAVPNYSIGWSPGHKGKPVLRAPVTVTTSFIETQDSLAIAREKRKQQYIQRLEQELKPINN
jgi:hypothetical protein